MASRIVAKMAKLSVSTCQLSGTETRTMMTEVTVAHGVPGAGTGTHFMATKKPAKNRSCQANGLKSQACLETVGLAGRWMPTVHTRR